MNITRRTPADIGEITALLDLCFGPDRKRRTAERLRRGAPLLPEASFVAREKARSPLLGTIECHVLCWTPAAGQARPIILLGPLAISPSRAGEGFGRALMACALAAADRRHLPVMLIGDEPYYRRWGFSAGATADWELPGPVERPRLLLRSQTPGLWRGPASFAPAGEAQFAA